ncbi:hypothetical protein NKJ48_31965 [Mesorhizobium sp. M0114]|uniref:hypothetical protein n=1 Tax=unclassified Mesorhizobium TaxID=325217 RepID=UPI003338C456
MAEVGSELKPAYIYHEVNGSFTLQYRPQRRILLSPKSQTSQLTMLKVAPAPPADLSTSMRKRLV